MDVKLPLQSGWAIFCIPTSNNKKAWDCTCSRLMLSRSEVWPMGWVPCFRWISLRRLRQRFLDFCHLYVICDGVCLSRCLDHSKHGLFSCCRSWRALCLFEMTNPCSQSAALLFSSQWFPLSSPSPSLPSLCRDFLLCHPSVFQFCAYVEVCRPYWMRGAKDMAFVSSRFLCAAVVEIF